MAQPMPVVRQIYWLAILPQLTCITLLALAVHISSPTARFPVAIGAGAFIYLAICQLLRAIFIRDQIRGMRSYRARKFQEAIDHFQNSYQFFSSHRSLD